MVGFIPEPSTEEDPNQVPKLKNFKDPIDFIEPKTNDLNFADSFLDFDSIKEWFEDNPNLDRIGFEESEFGDIEKSMETGKADVSDTGVSGSEPVGGNSGCTVKVEEDDSKPEKKLSSSIEEEMEKVSLVGGLERENGSSEECDSESSSSSGSSEGGNNNSEESESETSSSSSSSVGSSDDDDDEEEEEEEEEEQVENKEKVMVEIKREVDGAGELEEGEIGGIDGETADGVTDNLDEDEEDGEADEMLSEFGIEFDEVDDEDDAGTTRGPIRSKNELEFLPLVPSLDVTLQSHHQMLPIGVVLSIVGTKVIVEGKEKHNPLNEGSILWITLDRSPLGLVDEIFGPVTNPYYVVRYNLESQIPDGIYEGTSISFVPEFANHVLNDKNLHKKGYDASGENDEELSDYAEFSDDEKEAEYKRVLKMTKRGMNDHRVGNWKGNKKKVNSRDGARNNDRNSAQETSNTVGQLPPNQNQHNISIVSAALDNQNYSYSLVGGQNFVGGSSFVQPFSVMSQSSGFMTPSNGVWNGMLGQQPQNPIFPNRFPAEGATSLLENYRQQPIPLPTPAMPIPTMMSYQQQQQFDPSLGTLPRPVLPGGQSNLFPGPACAPWLGTSGQNGFSQTTFGVSMQGQQLLNAVQSILANVRTADGNCNVQPRYVADKLGASQNFNMGDGFGTGMQGQQLLSAVQGFLANGAEADGKGNVQSQGVTDNFETSQNFNMGASSSRGRKPYHRGRGRGRGRFMGRRGRQQS